MTEFEQELGNDSEEFSDVQHLYFLTVHLGLLPPLLNALSAELLARKQDGPSEPIEIKQARQVKLEGVVHEVNRIAGTTFSVEQLFGFLGFPPSNPFGFAQPSNEKPQKCTV